MNERSYHDEAASREEVYRHGVIIRYGNERKNGIIRTCGGYFFSNSWNSDAHSPQGYSLEVRWKYELRASRSSKVGCWVWTRQHKEYMPWIQGNDLGKS